MTEVTLNKLHVAYNKAVKSSTIGIYDVVINLINELYQLEDIPQKDITQFNRFLLGLERCRDERANTFEMTNLCSDLLFCIMFIQAWLNEKLQLLLDVDYIARRKSLESELTKILNKAVKNSNSCGVDDRFGVQAIVLNDEIELIYDLSNSIIGILTSIDRVSKHEFLQWILNNPKIPKYSKDRIIFVLNIPWELADCSISSGGKKFNPLDHPEVIVPKKSLSKYKIKDRIRHPKWENGHQDLKYKLLIPAFSKTLPGEKFEIQLKNGKMHDYSTHGPASHNEYKDDNILKEISAVFTLESFDNNLRGFYKYGDNVLSDLDGLHHAKIVYHRRMNKASYSY